MSEHKQMGVIYLERNALHFLAGAMQNVLTLQFPPEVMRDLDVVDVTQLDQVIKNFVETNKIPPTAASLILAEDILFMKDFVSEIPKPPVTPGQQPAQPEPEKVKIDPIAEAQKYLESVPFEEVGSKSEPIPNGIRVIVANKDTYNSLKNSFNKVGISIESVTPVQYFEKFLNMASGFTPDVARTMIQRSDVAKQNSLLMQHQSYLLDSLEKEKNKDEEKKPNIRLFAMIGVFAVLIIIMIVMFMRMQAQNNADKQKSAQKAVSVPVAFTPTPTIDVAASEASIAASLKIQILTTSQKADTVSTLKDSFIQDGFVNTTADTTQPNAPQKTTLVVQSTVDATTREKVLALVKAISPDATIVESNTADALFDIVVTLGKK